jgi:thiamine-monophosphate kinase
MIDVSDGVLADAAHLAAASALCCEVEADRVPVHESATPEAALEGGEEFELLFTIPADHSSIAERFRKEFRLDVTRIGRCVSGQGVLLLRGGTAVPLPEGFQHF